MLYCIPVSPWDSLAYAYKDAYKACYVVTTFLKSAVIALKWSERFLVRNMKLTLHVVRFARKFESDLKL